MPEPIHVLVVDDDDDVREMLELVLAAEGFRVTSAADGRQALAQLDADRHSVVLLDLRMPVLSGWQAIDVLRERGQLDEVPIVICTSSPDDAPPGFPVVPKPINLARLIAIVRGLASRSMSA